MSTILDALRKVERERDASPEHPLEPQPLAPEVRRRRNVPVTAIAICAVLGFAGGALLSWWTPKEESVEVASLPAPPPPPAIAVPRAPMPEPPVAAAPAPPPAEAPAPPPAEPAVVASAPAAPSAPEVVAEAPPPPAEQPAAHAPAVVAVERHPAEPAPAAPPPSAPSEPAPSDLLASLGKDGTALEPSPFGPARNAPREAAPPAVAAVPPSAAAKPPIAAKPPAVAKPPATATDRAERDLAAVAPLEPAAPEPAPAEIAPEPQPEPETSPENVFDTGRSPPGAPKVALSFLQWSADPAKRFAFVSIDGQPSQRIREGESAAGMTVAAITPTGVQFKREGTTFVIRPRH